MRFRGLAFRFSVIILAGTLVIFTLAFLYTFNYTRKILLKEAERDARFLTEITIARLEAVLKPLEQIPRSLVTIMDPEAADPYRNLLKTQNAILENPVVFASCIALEPNSVEPGTTYYAHYIYETGSGIGSKFLGGVGYNYFGKDWYRLPKETGEACWIGPYYDDGGGDTLMCTYSVPFYRHDQGEKKFAGVLTMDISLSALSGIVSSVRAGETGYAFLLSKEGRFITAPDPSFLNKDIHEFAGKDNAAAIVNIGRMLRGGTGFLRMNELRTSEPSWLYYTLMPSTGWHFAVVFRERELFADLYEFLKRLVVIFLASVLAILVTVVVISRNLARPLTRLALATRQIGQGDLRATLPKIRSRSEVGELTTSFSAMQVALQGYIANLQAETVAREKIESELDVARTIQMGLLPKAFPDRPEFDLYAELIPAHAIGGDLYDFFFLDDDHLFIAVGDVSGKGVPASLFMAITRTLFRSLIDPAVPLEHTVTLINEELCKDNPNSIFVTFLAGVLRLSTGVLELCNAGHNPPLLRTPAGTVSKIRIKTNIPLGVSEAHVYASDRITLRPGDQLVLFTDGITEAENQRAELFGEARLGSLVSETMGSSPATLTGQIISGVRMFTEGAEQSDDITLMVLTLKEAGTLCELLLRSEIAELGTLKEAMDRLTVEWNMPAGVMMALNLVLEELFTNIVYYGFDDGRDHLVRILIKKEPVYLVITIEDDGKPFNILESVYKGFGATLEGKEIGGEGIHLVKELMETIEYYRTGGRNKVVMKKKIS
jgi:sigma-B regulation protein RsbU (phosphoserine phosphatase)